MNSMKTVADSPKVYVPPPLFYVGIFIASSFIQGVLPINDEFLKQAAVQIAGLIFIILAVPLLFRSLRQFFMTKNTLITIKPAYSLQTDGIYRTSRNPMYLGLTSVYLAVTCFIGNWWNIILFPLLIIVVQEYIIKREERYLMRRFGQVYIEYMKAVRRWI